MVQPLLVSMSAIDLAAETVRSILKIDDIVSIGINPRLTPCSFSFCNTKNNTMKVLKIVFIAVLPCHFQSFDVQQNKLFSANMEKRTSIFQAIWILLV